MKVRRGITRTVLVGRRWAIKVPSYRYRRLVRGWLANQSEWRQRRRTDVARPRFTLLHFALVMPAAVWTGDFDEQTGPWLDRTGDEGKPCSWGWFDGRGWLLVDYDRSWDDEPFGLVGRFYWGHQARLARRWMRLPDA